MVWRSSYVSDIILMENGRIATLPVYAVKLQFRTDSAYRIHLIHCLHFSFVVLHLGPFFFVTDGYTVLLCVIFFLWNTTGIHNAEWPTIESVTQCLSSVCHSVWILLIMWLIVRLFVRNDGPVSSGKVAYHRFEPGYFSHRHDCSWVGCLESDFQERFPSRLQNTLKITGGCGYEKWNLHNATPVCQLTHML